jgi:hypothetical protein
MKLGKHSLARRVGASSENQHEVCALHTVVLPSLPSCCPLSRPHRPGRFSQPDFTLFAQRIALIRMAKASNLTKRPLRRRYCERLSDSPTHQCQPDALLSLDSDLPYAPSVTQPQQPYPKQYQPTSRPSHSRQRSMNPVAFARPSQASAGVWPRRC